MHMLPWWPERALYTGKLNISSLLSPTVSLSKRYSLHASSRGSHCARVGFVATEFFDGRHLSLRYWVLIKSQKWATSVAGLCGSSGDRLILFPRVTNTPGRRSAHSLGCHGLVSWYPAGRPGYLTNSTPPLVLHPERKYLANSFKATSSWSMQ